jgi:hemerythrin superfamily protein
MATAKKSKSASKPSTARPTTETDNEAIAQLTADHARVKKLFKQYDRLAKSEADSSERQELAMTICAELTAHATAEEEIFYPAAREALDDADLIDEAEVEHASAKDLIAQIQSASPEDELFDAKVKVLGEYIDHHVQEEEGEIFPKVRKAKLDTVELGEEIAARKAQIMGELGMDMAMA